MPKSVSIHIESRTHDWQRQLAQAISNTDELLAALNIPPQQRMTQVTGCGDFPLRVTRHYLDKIRPGDLQDPLLLQVLVRAREFDAVPGYQHDPVGDLASVKAPGLLHKYHGRALLITTAACAIHCRYCFRRHFPYTDHQPRQSEWDERISYLRRHKDIREIILSGGDPLMLSDDKLDEILQRLESVPRLQYCRIHSRLPTLVTGRFTDQLLQRMAASRLQFILVTHINHAHEINASDSRMFDALHQAGIQLLNQSVLLHQVNASAETLAELSHTLFQNHVLPYYLHMLDPVAGAAHFEVDPSTVPGIMEALRARLPGYLVPRLVREITGNHSKSPVIGL